MMPSGHKAFLVHNPKDVELLLMHNRTYAAEYVFLGSTINTRYFRLEHIQLTNSSGSPTPSLPASVSTSSPRLRLSVLRLPTPRAVSPLRLKWNEPQKFCFVFLYRWGIRRSMRASGFLYGRDTISLAITNLKDCMLSRVRFALGHSAGRIEQEKSSLK